MVVCARCGTENPEGFRFCGNCAAPLAAEKPTSGERRKVVSVLFCDVAGSTSMGEQRDPEQVRAVMARYFDTARAALERHGGTVEKFIGDAVMAVFGHPTLHEDDALRAVRAASDLRADLATLNVQLAKGWGATIEVRIGINTGPVVAGEGGSAETLVTGDAVNVAARLQTAAAPGETLIGADTYALVRDAVSAEPLEPLTLKGKELPVAAWRLIGVTPEAAGHTRHLDSPMVGRERELRLLHEAFEQALADRGAVLFTLLGPAGVGKSRLVGEFIAQVSDRGRVLRGRCLPYGEGITYWPLAEVVKSAADIAEADDAETASSKILALVAADPQAASIAAHVSGTIGLAAASGGGEEIFWAARRLLEMVAADDPLVLVFDDIQWAEPTFLDLIDHIADWSRDAPILLLCIARPELLEVRPTWGGGKLNATALLLQPMGGDDVVQLVENLLGRGALSASVAERVREASEGNPLFVEEFIAMLIDDGMLGLQDDRWVAVGDLEKVNVPPTIRSLLAARIDRLAKPERSAIERASVVGKIFWRNAVADLAPEPLRPTVGPSLLALVRKELVRPDRSDFAGDEAYRFRHLLLRDAAYDALPKHERADLHERFARWLERTAGQRLAEYEEVVGYHLEQAYRYLEELGTLDDGAQSLAQQAASRLAAAGLRASSRNDAVAARKLLSRSVSLFAPTDPERLRPLIRLGKAEVVSGELDQAELHFGEAIERGTGSGETALAWRARLALAQAHLVRGAPDGFNEADRVISAALRELSALGDDDGLAEAFLDQAQVAFWQGDIAASRDAARLAAEHARRTANEELELDALTQLAGVSVFDDSPVEDSLAETALLVERARAAGRRFSELRTLGIQGRLLAMTGAFERARSDVLEAIEGLRELGMAVNAAGGYQWLGGVEWAADNAPGMERALRESVTQLERLGENAFRVSSLAVLGTALAKQGRFAEALEKTEQSRSEAPAYDPDAQMQWRLGSALALAGLQRSEEAEALADDAIRIGVEGASPLDLNLALIELGDHVYRDPSRAVEVLRRAHGFFASKHARPMVERIEARLLELEGQGAGEAATADA